MQNFDFYNPVEILFGKGQIKELSNKIPKDKRILMTFGGGSIKRNGVYDQVKQALTGYTIFEFGGIEPNPHFETVMKAVELVKQEKIDFLLAVGGGSVLDGTKFIAAASLFEGDPWLMLSEAVPPKAALPLASVMTLPATGSEMNCGAVITRAETHDKLPFQHPLVFPKFSILDPETTFSLPPKQTANGIVDSFIHVVEQYVCTPINAPLQDRFAEAILLTLIEEGPKVLKNPTDYEARANIMWSATMALNGLIGKGVPQDWLVHFLGHEITAMFGVDHGQTLAIIQPSMWHLRREEKKQKLLQYGERVWNITSGAEDERINLAIQKTREFFESLGVKTHLRDYDISKEAISKLVEKLKSRAKTMIGRNRNDFELYERVLEEAYE